MTVPRPSLETRASGVRISKPKPGQDRRTGDQYRAALAQETEVSLQRSASWRNGEPLEDHERWPRLRSDGLGNRSGIPDLPSKGRWG
jgi:hypothetical protein